MAKKVWGIEIQYISIYLQRPRKQTYKTVGNRNFHQKLSFTEIALVKTVRVKFQEKINVEETNENE